MSHAQITQRQRGVGGEPVGKSKNSIGIEYAITAGNAFASSPATSVPGRLATYGSRKATSRYPSAGSPSASAAPITRKTQPRTLPARVTMSRPSVEKPPTTTITRTR